MWGFPSIARSLIARNCSSGKLPCSIFCFLKLNAATGAISATSRRTNVIYFCSSALQSPPNAENKLHDFKGGKSKRFGRQSKKFSTNNRFSKMIEIIKKGEDDMESNLSLFSQKLSLDTIAQIFQVLNFHKASGLRFFRWVQVNNPHLFLSGEFCSLIIDNCGWLDDYDTMLILLKEFKSKGICLTQNAFSFCPVHVCGNASMMDSLGRLIDLLNMVGGSCRNSGVCELINMFCKLDTFDVAEKVIEMTEKKNSYYHILIRERCYKGNVEEVVSIIRKMKEHDCEPTIETYNYLFSCLLKKDQTYNPYRFLEEIKENGISPDAVTFEIMIHQYCRRGKSDFAIQLIDKMMNVGVEPRILTHDMILKALFKSKKYVVAREYVVDMSGRYKRFTSVLYCLLARLHLRNGQLVEALDVITELMDKGNKPDSRVYLQIVSKLQKSSLKDSVEDLQNKYSSFR